MQRNWPAMNDELLSAPPVTGFFRQMERIYRYRMTTASGGNLSIRKSNGDIWITPARVDRGALCREDIVLVRTDGTKEGIRRPSSELPLHQAVYQRRPDVRGIVHAHPVALVAFSLVREVPNTRLFHQSWHVRGKGALRCMHCRVSASKSRSCRWGNL
jgi:L-fuculose-phosphate aldolase